MLLAANKGQDQMDEFVEKNLMPHEEKNLLSGHPAKEQVFDSLQCSRFNSQMDETGIRDQTISQGRQKHPAAPHCMLHMKLEDQSTSTTF